MIHVCDAVMGTGKAQPISTPVFTKTGYRPMGEIRVGDEVFGDDGKLHKVIGVFPQGIKKVYKVTFSDRTSTECCADHLWTYQYPQDKAKGVFRTSSLAELMKCDLYKTTNRGDKNWQYFIPITRPVCFPKRKLLIDPYVLGILLGDGSLQNSATFTNSETDVVQRVSERLPEGYVLHTTTSPPDHAEAFIITSPSRRPNDPHVVMEALRKYGLFGAGSYDKFIPEDYLYSSIDDRIELLKGLIDSDGCTSGGKMDFSSTSFQLIKDVQFIVQSLGGTAVLTTKQNPFYVKNGERIYCHDCYRLYIRLEDLSIACSSSKHLSNIRSVIYHTGVCRSIRNIEYMREDECQCILIDSKSHLYLTNDMIVTHNTSASIDFINRHLDRKFIYITPYLDEATRIRKGCPKAHFVEPSNKLRRFHFRKIEHTASLVEEGKNITTTHQAFRGYTQKTLDLIKEQGYTLIIDENVDVLEPLTTHPDDVRLAIDAGYIKENNNVLYLGDKPYNGKALSELFMLLRSREILRVYDQNQKEELYYWSLPPSLITAFQDVFVLTYLFSGQSLHHFFEIYNLPYEYIGIERTEDGGYRFGQCPGYVPEYISHIKEKLIVLDNPKLNQIGDDDYSLSMNWFKRDEDGVEQLRKNVANYFVNIFRDVPANRRLWGSYNGSAAKLRGKGYTNAFLPFNTKATNAFKNRDCLVYVPNIFMNVNEKKFYEAHGIEVDEDAYALSIMIQWIWRSAIRDGHTVHLYIPSRRMRTLLLDWMDKLSEEVNPHEV